MSYHGDSTFKGCLYAAIKHIYFTEQLQSFQYIDLDGEIDRQTHRQTDRQIDRQIHRKTDRQCSSYQLYSSSAWKWALRVLFSNNAEILLTRTLQVQVCFFLIDMSLLEWYKAMCCLASCLYTQTLDPLVIKMVSAKPLNSSMTQKVRLD